MIYKMNDKQYSILRASGLSDAEIIDHCNDRMNLQVIKQTSVIAKDDFGTQKIDVAPIRQITDFVTYHKVE